MIHDIRAFLTWWMRRATWKRILLTFILLTIVCMCIAPYAAQALAQDAIAGGKSGPSFLTWINLQSGHETSVWNYQLSLDQGNAANLSKSVNAVITQFFWTVYVSWAVVAIWLIVWALSGDWIAIFAEPFAALGTALKSVVLDTGIATFALVLAMAIAGVFIMRGNGLRGWSHLVIASCIAAFMATMLASPVTAVIGEDGFIKKSLSIGQQVGITLSNSEDQIKQRGKDSAEAVQAQMAKGVSKEDAENMVAAAKGASIASTPNVASIQEQALVDTLIVMPLQTINFGSPLRGKPCEKAYNDTVGKGPYTDDAPEIRDAIAEACPAQKAVADNPDFGMALSPLLFLGSATAILVLAIVVAVGVILSGISTAYHALKIIYQGVIAVVPTLRGGFTLTMSSGLICLMGLIFASIFLSGFISVLQIIFTDNAGPQRFAIATIFIWVAIVVYITQRARINAAAKGLAEKLRGSSKPTPSKPAALPALNHSGSAATPRSFLARRLTNAQNRAALRGESLTGNVIKRVATRRAATLAGSTLLGMATGGASTAVQAGVAVARSKMGRKVIKFGATNAYKGMRFLATGTTAADKETPKEPKKTPGVLAAINPFRKRHAAPLGPASTKTVPSLQRRSPSAQRAHERLRTATKPKPASTVRTSPRAVPPTTRSQVAQRAAAKRAAERKAEEARAAAKLAAAAARAQKRADARAARRARPIPRQRPSTPRKT